MLNLRFLKFAAILPACALTLGMAYPQSALAQDIVKQYDPDYRPDFLDDIVKMEEEVYLSTGIDKNMTWTGSFVRVPGADPNDLIMRLTLPQTISGCYETSKPKAEIKYSGTNVRVEIIPMRINMADTQREYTHHNCNVKSGAPHFDITFDRAKMIEEEVKNLMIMAKGQSSGGLMKLDINDERVVTVTPIGDMIVAGKDPTNGNNINIFWTYPENTVILYNENLPLDDENIEKLAAFAKNRGLVPLTDYLPDFRIEASNRHGMYFLNAKHKMYFVDKTGAFASQLKNVDDVTSLGMIELTETFHGPDGPYEKNVEIPVFMKRPGLYE